MDHQRFDDLARALATSTSRRRVLRGLAGGVLASLGALAPAATLATHTGCRHHGKPCSRRGQCCSGRCTTAGVCRCPSSRKPCGTTACCDPATQHCCGGACVPLSDTCCTIDADCDDGDACTDNTCNTTTHTCASTNLPGGTQCTQNGGRVCDGQGHCVECTQPSDCPDTGGTCQTRICSTNTCAVEFEPNGTPCTPAGGGTGSCQNGSCQV
jgi:hypothetical protein